MGLDEALDKEDVEIEETPARRIGCGSGLRLRRLWSGRRRKGEGKQGRNYQVGRGAPQVRRICYHHASIFNRSTSDPRAKDRAEEPRQ